nr:unnamed protein product [Digitaria exilis]
MATRTDRVLVCNPATRELAALPLGTHNAELDHCEYLVPGVAIGFDQWRNLHVIARYFYRQYGEIFVDQVSGERYADKDHNVGHEIFTLGGGSSWELTQDPPYPVGVQRPICTRQAIYWHADEPRPQLMRFGLQHRGFAVVPRPPTAGWNPLHDMAAGLDRGKLCYVHAVAEASFEVWMADEDDDVADDLEWSLRCRVHLPAYLARNNVNYSFMPVIVDGDGDTLVWRKW